MDSGPRTTALSDTGTGRAPGRDYSRVADIAIATLDHRSIHEIETFGSVHGTRESLRPCHTHDSPRGCVITVIAEPMRVVIGYPIHSLVQPNCLRPMRRMAPFAQLLRLVMRISNKHRGAIVTVVRCPPPSETVCKSRRRRQCPRAPEPHRPVPEVRKLPGRFGVVKPSPKSPSLPRKASAQIDTECGRGLGDSMVGNRKLSRSARVKAGRMERGRPRREKNPWGHQGSSAG